MRRPIFGETIDHPIFKVCLSQLRQLGDLLPPETIILIVGPSHAGKSTLLGYFVAHLQNEVFRKCGAREVPIIGATAQTTREGRTAPKFILHELLEDVGHPLLQMPLLFDDDRLYKPAIKLDETWCLRSLKSALHAAAVRSVLIDDAHYLVRVKDEHFKSSLLESFKSVVTPITTLVLSGGYELAKVALANRAHLSSRIIVVHVPRYRNTPEDLLNWKAIISKLSKSPRVKLEHPDLLASNAAELLYECHGGIGVLEKRILNMVIVAGSHGTPITKAILAETRPTSAAWEAVRLDIENGEKLLGTKVGIVSTDAATASSSKNSNASKNSHSKQSRNKKRKRQRAFERKATRTQKALEV